VRLDFLPGFRSGSMDRPILAGSEVGRQTPLPKQFGTRLTLIKKASKSDAALDLNRRRAADVGTPPVPLGCQRKVEVRT